MVLFLILILYVVKEINLNNKVFKHNMNNLNLEECISLNIPCVNHTPSFWELQNIKGIGKTGKRSI